MFATSASKLRPVGAILALIIVYALDLISKAPIGELATRALLYAWLIAAFPALTCIIVNLVLGPAPRKLAEQALCQRLQLAAAMLRSEQTQLPAFQQVLRDGTAEIGKFLKFAKLEKTSTAEELARLAHVTESISAVLLSVEVVRQQAPQLLPVTVKNDCAAALDAIAAAIRSGACLRTVHEKLHTDPRQFGVPMLPCASAIANELCAALRQLSAFSPREPEHAENASAAGEQVASAHSGFFAPDAFTNPEHLRYALKTTAAAMSCYLMYTLLSWPGIHTCLITCYVVALGTTGETLEKLRLRIVGCVLGAATGLAAIVFVMPDIDAVSIQLAVVFIGALLAAWVAGGSEKISYAGLQIAFAFFLCVIQGASPGFDLVTIRDRVLGILFGNLMVYLVFTYVWPVTIAPRIDQAINTVLQQLGQMRHASTRAAREQIAEAANANLSAIERDLDVIRFEPTAIRPAAEWIARRQQTAHQIGLLLGPLTMCFNQHVPSAPAVASRLERLATVAGAASSQQAQHDLHQPASTLSELLEHPMQDLERSYAKHDDHRKENYASA
jgi:multidrug resistance protein MdtO